MYFRNYGAKHTVRSMSKKPCFRTPFDSHHVSHLACWIPNTAEICKAQLLSYLLHF